MATPLSIVVFDIGVFDAGVVDATEISPVVVRLAVPKEMWNAEFGMTVSIFAHIYGYSSSSRVATPLNVPVPPEIEVYDPYDSSGVGFVPMTHRDDGTYLYQYFIANNAWLGAYSARVRVSNGGVATISKKAVVFKILEN